jgi:hypothetical protein
MVRDVETRPLNRYRVAPQGECGTERRRPAGDVEGDGVDTEAHQAVLSGVRPTRSAEAPHSRAAAAVS